MIDVKNMVDVQGWGLVASDFDSLLSDSSNADIATEFPASVARYTGDIAEVEANLLAAQLDCRPGVRQQFVAFSGVRAVGMSVVRLVDDPPYKIDPAWPNVSVFVCNPYRGQGIGRLSMIAHAGVIADQFGGHAWTRVRTQNAPSRCMVERAGFVPVREDAENIFYTYRSSEV